MTTNTNTQAQAPQLSTYTAQELLAALKSGKASPVAIFEQLTKRAFPPEALSELYGHLATIKPDWITPIALRQAELSAAAKPEKSKRAAIRRSAGTRDRLTIQPPVAGNEGKNHWMLTATSAAWLWVIDHADDVRAAVAEAEKVSDDTLLQEQLAKASK